MQIEKYLWSSNWWLEGSKLYICASCYAAIFCVDIATMQCEFLARIPECKFKSSRSNSYCRKYKEKVFCFPYGEKYICYYDLEKKLWSKIEVGFEGNLMICLDNDDIENVNVWLMEYRGRKIYQVNIEKKIVEREYIIPADRNVFTGYYVFVQDNLYCTAGNEIYCINIRDGTITAYQIAEPGIEIYTICYDGCNFWLSGNREVIYIWNVQEGLVKIITDFVEDSTDSSVIIKNAPLFGSSMLVGRYVWFIPLQGNMPILYIDRDSYRVRVLEIEEEKETEKEIVRRGNAFKYAFEYIRQNRYIGLYSCKNQMFLEIDTVDLCVKYRRLCFSDQTFIAIAWEAYADMGILYEGVRDGQEIFSILLNRVEEKKNIYLNIGKQIYSSISF